MTMLCEESEPIYTVAWKRRRKVHAEGSLSIVQTFPTATDSTSNSFWKKASGFWGTSTLRFGLSFESGSPHTYNAHVPSEGAFREVFGLEHSFQQDEEKFVLKELRFE